jgi:hypothetical protein
MNLQKSAGVFVDNVREFGYHTFAFPEKEAKEGLSEAPKA